MEYHSNNEEKKDRVECKIFEKSKLPSNLVIRTNSVDFKVHDLIVGNYFSFFATALEYKKSGAFASEDKKSVIDCLECDSRIAGIALGLAYPTGKYKVKKEIQTVSDLRDLFQMMKKWLMDEEELNLFASEWFEEMLRDKDSVIVAEARNEGNQKKERIGKEEEHAEEVEEENEDIEENEVKEKDQSLEIENLHQKRAVLFALCCDFSEDKDLHVRVGKRLSVLLYYEQMEEQLSRHPRALASLCSQMSKVMKVMFTEAAFNEENESIDTNQSVDVPLPPGYRRVFVCPECETLAPSSCRCNAAHFRKPIFDLISEEENLEASTHRRRKKC